MENQGQEKETYKYATTGINMSAMKGYLTSPRPSLYVAQGKNGDKISSLVFTTGKGDSWWTFAMLEIGLGLLL